MRAKAILCAAMEDDAPRDASVPVTKAIKAPSLSMYLGIARWGLKVFQHALCWQITVQTRVAVRYGILMISVTFVMMDSRM
jgi:hypothetical protein